MKKIVLGFLLIISSALAQEDNTSSSQMKEESFQSRINITTDFGGLGAEYTLSKGMLVGGSFTLQNLETTDITQSSSSYEAHVHLAKDVLSDTWYYGLYVAAGSANSSVTYTEKVYTVSGDLYKVGALLGYRWMWDNLNISIDFGYGLAFGSLIDSQINFTKEIAGDSGAAIIAAILPLYSTFKFGWAF